MIKLNIINMRPREMTVNVLSREFVRYKVWHKGITQAKRQIQDGVEIVIRNQIRWTIFNQVYSYDQIES